jgi:N-acetylmuramoyl-L-alanine amidase
MLHHVLDQTGAVSRGVKGGNLHVIRETDMPAVLVEAGFMTNRAEWTNIRNKKYLERIAKGIALGVDRYIKS